ncbi:MFS general substrate transporter [Thozetella sp. PMI_491]|nr:MFS general substrate transporter [Thozetella sp. PMI_491]
MDSGAPKLDDPVAVDETTALLASDGSAGRLDQRFDGRDPEWLAARNAALLRKIDLSLIPFLVTMYLLNFLDRTNLAQARQGTLEKDLGMSGTNFNLATSVFFVGYLMMQLPSNMAITRLPPSRYLSAAMTLWGVVSTCNAAVHNFPGLVVVRFLLGFVEAPFFPGAVFLMSSWYTRAELTQRISWLYSGAALANMFGGLLGAAILGGLEGVLGIAGWRWLFLIEGTATVLVALMSGFVLPDYPHTTRWLSEEERAFAAWRLLKDINETSKKRSTSALEGLKMALKDYRLYIFLPLQHANQLTQTFQYFFPAIVGTLNFGPIVTLWLTVPIWFVTFLVSVFVTWTSSKANDRSGHIIILMLIACLGNVIFTLTTGTGPRFFAMFLMPMGSMASYQIVVSWVANSFPTPPAKRSATIAICNMLGNSASIYGSYMYPSSDAPRYFKGGVANIFICLAVAALALILRVVHQRENRRLEQADAAAEQTPDGVEDEPSNRRPAGFRYIC